VTPTYNQSLLWAVQLAGYKLWTGWFTD